MYHTPFRQDELNRTNERVSEQRKYIKLCWKRTNKYLHFFSFGSGIRGIHWQAKAFTCFPLALRADDSGGSAVAIQAQEEAVDTLEMNVKW